MRQEVAGEAAVRTMPQPPPRDGAGDQLTLAVSMYVAMAPVKSGAEQPRQQCSAVRSSSLLALYQLLHTKFSIKYLRDGSFILSCWLGAALLHSHCLCSGKHGLSNWPSLFLLRDALVSRR
jgi:hypothetical protein